jgi:hypothetical protein
MAEQQKKMEEEAKQQKAEALALMAAEAEVRETMAKVDKLTADAQKIRSEIGMGDGGAGQLEQQKALQKIEADARRMVERLRDQVKDAQFRSALAKMGNETKERIAALTSATDLQVAQIGAQARLGVVDLKGAIDADMAADEFSRQTFQSLQDKQFEADQGERDRRHTEAQEQRKLAYDAAKTVSTQRHDADKTMATQRHDAEQRGEDRRLAAATTVHQTAAKAKDEDKKLTTQRDIEAERNATQTKLADKAAKTTQKVEGERLATQERVEGKKAEVADRSDQRKQVADQRVRKLTEKIEKVAKDVDAKLRGAKGVPAKKSTTKR